MSNLEFIREFFQIIGAILALVLTYYYIKEVRSKTPQVSVDVKRADVLIGRDIENIEDPYTGEKVDERIEVYSDFRFTIEFQNKGNLSTYITGIKVSLSSKEPKVRNKSFQFFEVPKRQAFKYGLHIGFYCKFTLENNPITLEFTTLDGNIIKEIVEISKESINHETDFHHYLGH